MDITNSPSGQITKLPTGYSAFVPNPLPPKLEWDVAVVNALSSADYLLGKLAREGSKLQNPHLIMRPFRTREAVLSSKIEGTQTTLREILESSIDAHKTHNPDDLREVQNYIKALDYGCARLTELPLSLRLLREIHGHLMQGVRGEHATPGEFRLTQNWIGSPGSTLNTAKFVPPPYSKLMECLGHFETFLHDKTLPPLIHMALCHYQFEAIHPFLDGNGRVGRLLITLLLIERQILSAPLLYLSAFFEATRDEYYAQLYNVSAKGTWNQWLIYFLNGVRVQSADVLSRIQRINTLIDQWSNKLAKNGSYVALNVLQSLTANPYFTTNTIAKSEHISYSTAQRLIQKLQSSGIVKQTNDNKRDKVYCATAILDILEEPTKVEADTDD